MTYTIEIKNSVGVSQKIFTEMVNHNGGFYMLTRSMKCRRIVNDKRQMD